MTCEVKKILGFTAGFYEHSAIKFIKKLTFCNKETGFGRRLTFSFSNTLQLPFRLAKLPLM
jgi:hypothetical protein